MNRFYFTNTDALDTANFLDENGYEENDAIILKDNDDEPLQILIDNEQKTFCFIDNEGLKEENYKLKTSLNEIVQKTTYKEVLSWKN